MAAGWGTVIVTLATMNRRAYQTLGEIGLVMAVGIVVLVTTLFANVQSGTRFFSTNPVFYINAASFLMRKKEKGFTFGQYLVFLYFLTYNIAGVLWFPKRFNWS